MATFEARIFSPSKEGEEGILKIEDDFVKFGDLQLEYQKIVLHGISLDPEAFRFPCLYCQVEDGDAENMIEIRFVPKNSSDLQSIFEALSKCAALHPDETSDNEEGLEEPFFDASTPSETLEQYNIKVEPKVDVVEGQFDEAD